MNDDISDEIKEMLAVDSFYDDNRSGVKVLTPDPTRYHEIKGALSMAMPIVTGAVMIPRHKPGLDGGQMGGINVNKPGVINVDPHIPGGCSVVDLNKLTAEQKNAAYDPTVSTDHRIAGAVAFRKMAHSTKQVKTWISDGKTPFMNKSGSLKSSVDVVNEEPDLSEDEAVPLPALSNESSQIGRPTTITERKPIPEVQPMTIIEPQNQSQPTRLPPSQLFQTVPAPPQAYPIKQAPGTPNFNSVVPPDKRVTFEIPGIGMFEASYHEVVKDGTYLILVYDRRWTYSLKYMPMMSKDFLIVDVHSHPNVYKVHSCGIQYSVNNFEHCVLPIEAEVSK